MNPADITFNVIFYLIATVSIAGALTVVLARRVLRSAVALAFVLLGSAGFYVLLDYDFVAGIQVLVYVGGVVILIIYAVMLTSSLEIKEVKPHPGRKIMGFIAAALFFGTTMTALLNTEFEQTVHVTPENLTAEFGRMLLGFGSDGFVLPFEIISLLLLSAVIGSIVIARSGKDEKPEAIEIQGPIDSDPNTSDQQNTKQSGAK